MKLGVLPGLRLLLLPGLFMAGGSWNVWRGIASSHWPEATSTYAANVVFRYRVNGPEYSTGVIQFGEKPGPSNSSEAELRRMRYRAGSTVQVHSDPKDRTIAAVGSGEGRMIHVGQRKFTEAEELVRATGPFHIEIVAEIEPQVDLPALQLVNDGAVVNAMNGHARVKQTVSLPAVWAVIPEGRAWPRLLSVVCRVLSLRTARESPEFCVNASRIG